MRKTCVLIVAILLACPTFAADESREQKRLEACGQVFKEIMDIPDGIPKELLNKAECVIVIPSVLKFAIGIGGDFGRGAITCRLGVAPEVIDAFVESPRVEFERAKLYAGEGGRLEVFRTERRRFQTYYQNRSAGYRLFEFAVAACALILPPRNFYQLLGWYGRHNFARFRSVFGQAEPKVPSSFFQRRSVAESELPSS
jgi:hypothetical protein